jgi:hypothetical protein
MVPVMIRNAIVTLTSLLSGSPTAAVATHVIMHIAAALHGMETTWKRRCSWHRTTAGDHRWTLSRWVVELPK